MPTHSLPVAATSSPDRSAHPGVAPQDLAPPELVELRLRDALQRLDTARRDAVTWFGEIFNRRLYLAFECSSIYQYARERLGFSRARTAYFLRLVRAFEELPRLRASVESGDVPWTKARELVKVATPATEAAWVATARVSSRRELERKVAEVRGRAARQRQSPGQGELAIDGAGARLPEPSNSETRRGASPHSGVWATEPGVAGTKPAGILLAGTADSDTPPPPREHDPLRDIQEVPMDLTLRFSPEQYARFEALVERVRRAGERGSREELILAGLESLGGPRSPDGSTRPPNTESAGRGGASGAGGPESGGRGAASGAGGPNSDGRGAASGAGGPVSGGRGAASGGCNLDTRNTRKAVGENPTSDPAPVPVTPTLHPAPRYQVIVHQCTTCERTELPTSRGPLPINAVSLRTLLCDAQVQRPGERNRATIPPAVRRSVLARDRHQCRAPGCGSARFLDVHHVVPRSAGGGNHVDNLITLCAGCHRLVHGITDRVDGDAGMRSNPLAALIRTLMQRRTRIHAAEEENRRIAARENRKRGGNHERGGDPGQGGKPKSPGGREDGRNQRAENGLERS